jgi:T-complex protein 1 subunit gamma
MHPTVIIRAYRQALEDMILVLRDEIATPIDLTKPEQVHDVIKSCIGTKFISKWSDLAVKIAEDAVKTVSMDEHGRKEIDIKRYAKVEKIPGGRIEDSYVMKGIMLNKDVTHQKMSRKIVNPRILLLDCALEYKKGESMTNVELMKEEDFSKMLEQEEEYVQKMCEEIIRLKPDLLFTEKGVSDLAQHYLVKVRNTEAIFHANANAR